MIMQKDLRRPQQLAKLIDIYGQGQLRNEETMMAMLKQKQEAEAINNIAKMYQTDAASATPDVAGLNKIINSGSKAVFGLSRFGNRALPIIQAISADNKVRAGVIGDQLKAAQQKPVNSETRPTGNYKTENDVLLVEEHQVNPHTNEPIPGTAVYVPKSTAPGASTKASEDIKRQTELSDAQNLVASLEADVDFMTAYKTFENAGKFKLLQEGKIDEALSGMTPAQRAKMKNYLQAQTTIAKMTPVASGGAPKETPSQDAPPKKTLTEELARAYMKKAGGDKAKARQMAKDDGYAF